ncbi:MAG: hypothetical protein AB4290_23725 [Spirulina sp.]
MKRLMTVLIASVLAILVAVNFTLQSASAEIIEVKGLVCPPGMSYVDAEEADEHIDYICPFLDESLKSVNYGDNVARLSDDALILSLGDNFCAVIPDDRNFPAENSLCTDEPYFMGED